MSRIQAGKVADTNKRTMVMLQDPNTETPKEVAMEEATDLQETAVELVEVGALILSQMSKMKEKEGVELAAGVMMLVEAVTIGEEAMTKRWLLQTLIEEAEVEANEVQ